MGVSSEETFNLTEEFHSDYNQSGEGTYDINKELGEWSYSSNGNSFFTSTLGGTANSSLDANNKTVSKVDATVDSEGDYFATGNSGQEGEYTYIYPGLGSDTGKTTSNYDYTLDGTYSYFATIDATNDDYKVKGNRSSASSTDSRSNGKIKNGKSIITVGEVTTTTHHGSGSNAEGYSTGDSFAEFEYDSKGNSKSEGTFNLYYEVDVVSAGQSHGERVLLDSDGDPTDGKSPFRYNNSVEYDYDYFNDGTFKTERKPGEDTTYSIDGYSSTEKDVNTKTSRYEAIDGELDIPVYDEILGRWSIASIATDADIYNFELVKTTDRDYAFEDFDYHYDQDGYKRTGSFESEDKRSVDTTRNESINGGNLKYLNNNHSYVETKVNRSGPFSDIDGVTKARATVDDYTKTHGKTKRKYSNSGTHNVTSTGTEQDPPTGSLKYDWTTFNKDKTNHRSKADVSGYEKYENGKEVDSSTSEDSFFRSKVKSEHNQSLKETGNRISTNSDGVDVDTTIENFQKEYSDGMLKTRASTKGDVTTVFDKGKFKYGTEYTTEDSVEQAISADGMTTAKITNSNTVKYDTDIKTRDKATVTLYPEKAKKETPDPVPANEQGVEQQPQELERKINNDNFSETTNTITVSYENTLQTIYAKDEDGNPTEYDGTTRYGSTTDKNTFIVDADNEEKYFKKAKPTDTGSATFTTKVEDSETSGVRGNSKKDGHTWFKDDSVTVTVNGKTELGGTYETVGKETTVKLNDPVESPPEVSIDIVNKKGWTFTLENSSGNLNPTYFESTTYTDTYSDGTHKPETYEEKYEYIKRDHRDSFDREEKYITDLNKVITHVKLPEEEGKSPVTTEITISDYDNVTSFTVINPTGSPSEWATTTSTTKIDNFTRETFTSHGDQPGDKQELDIYSKERTDRSTTVDPGEGVVGAPIPNSKVRPNGEIFYLSINKNYHGELINGYYQVYSDGYTLTDFDETVINYNSRHLLGKDGESAVGGFFTSNTNEKNGTHLISVLDRKISFAGSSSTGERDISYHWVNSIDREHAVSNNVYEIGSYYDERGSRRQSAYFTKSNVTSDTGLNDNNYVKYRYDSEWVHTDDTSFPLWAEAETYFPIDAKLTFQTVGRYDEYGKVYEAILSPSYTGGQHLQQDAKGYTVQAAGGPWWRGSIEQSLKSSVSFEVYPGKVGVPAGDLVALARRSGHQKEFNAEISDPDGIWHTEEGDVDDLYYKWWLEDAKYQPNGIQYREYELASTKSTESTTLSNEEEPQTVEASPSEREYAFWDSITRTMETGDDPFLSFEEALLNAALAADSVDDANDALDESLPVAEEESGRGWGGFIYDWTIGLIPFVNATQNLVEGGAAIDDQQSQNLQNQRGIHALTPEEYFDYLDRKKLNARPHAKAGEAKKAIRGAVEAASDFYQAGIGAAGGGVPNGRTTSSRTQKFSKPQAKNGGALERIASHDNIKAPSNIPTINGRKPINSKFAGKTHPSGVKFKDNGFPDFTPYSKAQVELDGLTGNYAKDAALANKAAGLKRTPDRYLWHHVEDGRTLQLVPKSIHDATRHTGGAAVIRNGGSFD